VQDGLDLVADKLRLGQRGGVGGDEGQVEDAGQRFAEQGLAGAGRADEQDIALGQFDAVRRARRHAPEMAVDGHGERLLAFSWPITCSLRRATISLGLS
jgi:hypothetical protein